MPNKPSKEDREPDEIGKAHADPDASPKTDGKGEDPEVAERIAEKARSKKSP